MTIQVELNASRLWSLRHDVLYRAELSSLYHQKRERFFELLDKSAKAVSVFGGSAALLKAGSQTVIIYLGVLITFVSVTALVFGFSERARRHSDLKRRYRILIAEIMACGEDDFYDQNIRSWNEKLFLIEAEEPPTLSMLVRECQNEMALAVGQTERIKPIRIRDRILMNFFDIPRTSA